MNQKAAQAPEILVFTDLDGSLMEHESYSIELARPALAALSRRHALVIMNSSKTAAEMRAIQSDLKLQAPFVCENGAALHLRAAAEAGRPGIIEFGRARDDWLTEVHALRTRLNLEFAGFADWSVGEISELTGLAPMQAEQARQREYSEPILWRGSTQQKAHFEQELARLELILLEGGRFHSIQGRHGKHDAMRWLKAQRGNGRPVLTVALGDSPNDLDMLQGADIAVIIKSAKSERIELSGPARIIRTQRPGPAGWHDAIMDILSASED